MIGGNLMAHDTDRRRPERPALRSPGRAVTVSATRSARGRKVVGLFGLRLRRGDGGLDVHHGRPVRWEHDLTVLILDRGIPVCSSVGELARRSRRAVQRARQDLPQLVTILIGQLAQELQALRWRIFANHFNNFSRTTPTAVRQPPGCLEALIERRSLAPPAALPLSTPRDRDRLPARNREMQVDELGPAACPATDLPGQVDERQTPTTRVAGLTRAPRRAQIRVRLGIFAGFAVKPGFFAGVAVADYAHVGDCATAAGAVATVEVGGGLSRSRDRPQRVEA